MANAFLKKYPLDRTAKAVTNRVDDEPHDVGVQYNRIIAPNAGPYYEDSMVIYDSSGNKLVKGTDWDPISPYVEASITLGIPVSNMVVIKNKNITEVVLKTYQVPGGLYQTYTDAIIDLINTLMQDGREVKWDDIGGKPTAFQPTPHLHHLKDLYGYEYEILALEEILRAIQNGDIASHDAIYRYVDNLRQWTEDQLATIDDEIKDIYGLIDKLNTRIDNLIIDVDGVRKELEDHEKDHSNPHQVTKLQVGLGLVDNYSTATTDEATTGAATDRFITPSGVKHYCDANVIPVIQSHIDDKNNPHQVTKDQTGLGLVDNYPTATITESISGLATNRFVTPAGVLAYSNNKVLPVIQSHIDDKNNPHGVTKTQVGLGSVDNYPTASNQEAVAGVATDRFITPSGVAGYCNSKVMPVINNHISNMNNPHGVTVDQIGAVPKTRTVNGKSLVNDIVLNAGDVGTYTKAEIDAKIQAAITSVAVDIYLGPVQDYQQRTLQEHAGCVMTSWADYGHSNYWWRGRAFYYLKNGAYVLLRYS